MCICVRIMPCDFNYVYIVGIHWFMGVAVSLVQYSRCITMIWWAVWAYDDKRTWSLGAQSLGQLATAVGRFIDQIERRRHFLLATKSESIRIKKSLNWFTNHYPNIFYWRKLFGEKWGCHECLTRNLWDGWIKHSAHSTQHPNSRSSLHKKETFWGRAVYAKCWEETSGYSIRFTVRLSPSLSLWSGEVVQNEKQRKDEEEEEPQDDDNDEWWPPGWCLTGTRNCWNGGG